MNTKFYPAEHNYYKMLARLEKNIQSGRFASYTLEKKRQIWNRLCRYARQLGISIKSSVAAACLAAGLSFANPSSAQITFVQQTGANNPFNGIDIGLYSAPTFVDIDGDGDMDAFIGAFDGTIKYYKNTGTAAAAVFTEQTGAANPLNAFATVYSSFPTFVDVDGDGDMDAIIGFGYYTTIAYYKNTGTATAPVFTLQSGGANPLDGANVGYYSAPTFVDIDGDGDQDALIGTGYGTVLYYKNTGTATAPVFTLQSGGADPFSVVNVIGVATPAFADIDGDGDQDIFIGAQDGSISYFKNTGSGAVPAFTAQTGAANPFDGVVEGTYAVLALVDIDGDGDMDAFVGRDDGTIDYFKNTSPLLPLNLISFSGSKQAGFNQLQWQTTGEVNTKLFELERSIDGTNFTKVATIKTVGNGNNNYSAKDNGASNGKVFYRLKMVDIDGRFTYSQVIWINSGRGHISIYPNPATDLININIESAAIIKTMARMYDVNGRLVRNIFITNEQQPVDVHQLSKGAYIIKFLDGTTQGFIKK